MKIGIHGSIGTFNERWVLFCEEHNVSYKIVDCYKSDIVQQLSDCNALMWHHSQNNPKDLLIARQILFSVEHAGKVVFPDFKTNWHFDDKLGQKYLLESLNIPFVKSFASFDKREANEWANHTEFPVVFKLRRGAGSFNVKLIRTKSEAKKIIKTAFSSGFSNFNAFNSLKELIRKWKLLKVNNIEVIKGIVRFLIKPQYAKILGKEKGYVYFQEFIQGNDSDIRVIIIGDKAFAIKRMVRENDFRASGSGNIHYEKEHFDNATIKLAFVISEKLGSQCTAFDFVYKNGEPLVVEISYGFDPKGYESCTGFWNKNLEWTPGKFNPYGWMIEDVITKAVEN